MDRHLLKHPFYQDWMLGIIPHSMLQDYAKQYYFHVECFPRYLSALHSICENSDFRKDLLQNLNDEEGTGYEFSHPELWMHFAEGLGVPASDVRKETPRFAIQKVTDLFFTYCRRSFHEGLGALYAYESQVPEVAASKITGLRERYQITDPRTLAFFEVHQSADVEHRQVLAQMLETLPPEQKQQAQAAFDSVAQALWDFLSDVHSKEQNCA